MNIVRIILALVKYEMVVVVTPHSFVDACSWLHVCFVWGGEQMLDALRWKTWVILLGLKQCHIFMIGWGWNGSLNMERRAQISRHGGQQEDSLHMEMDMDVGYGHWGISFLWAHPFQPLWHCHGSAASTNLSSMKPLYSHQTVSVFEFSFIKQCPTILLLLLQWQ